MSQPNDCVGFSSLGSLGMEKTGVSIAFSHPCNSRTLAPVSLFLVQQELNFLSQQAYFFSTLVWLSVFL